MNFKKIYSLDIQGYLMALEFYSKAKFFVFFDFKTMIFFLKSNI